MKQCVQALLAKININNKPTTDDGYYRGKCCRSFYVDRKLIKQVHIALNTLIITLDLRNAYVKTRISANKY